MHVELKKNTAVVLDNENSQKVFNLGDAQLDSDITKLLKFYGEASSQTIKYVALKLENISPEILQNAVEVMSHLQDGIRIRIKLEPYFNQGYSPVLILMGHDLPDPFQLEMLKHGVIIYDLDQPSNARYPDSDSIVCHIEEMANSHTYTPPSPESLPTGEVTPEEQHELAFYYQPLNTDIPFSEIIKAINSSEE